MTDRELMQTALDALESDCDATKFGAAEAIRARLAQPELGVTLTAAKHPVSLGKPSEYRLSKESLEDVVLEREWQDLTGEEEDAIWDECLGVFDCLKMTQAKLKEKNG